MDFQFSDIPTEMHQISTVSFIRNLRFCIVQYVRLLVFRDIENYFHGSNLIRSSLKKKPSSLLKLAPVFYKNSKLSTSKNLQPRANEKNPLSRFHVSEIQKECGTRVYLPFRISTLHELIYFRYLVSLLSSLLFFFFKFAKTILKTNIAREVAHSANQCSNRSMHFSFANSVQHRITFVVAR